MMQTGLGNSLLLDLATIQSHAAALGPATYTKPILESIEAINATLSVKIDRLATECTFN